MKYEKKVQINKHLKKGSSQDRILNKDLSGLLLVLFN